MGYEQFYWDQIKSRVNRINSQFSEKDPLSFLRLVVSLVTGASSGEIDEFITEGGDDLGADAIQIEVNDEEKRFKIFIIQTKYNKESCAKGIFNKNIEQSVIDKFKNIFDYFASGTPSAMVNDEVLAKKEEYLDLTNEGYILDEIVFVSSNLGIGPAPNVKEIWDRWVELNPFKDRIKYSHFGLKEIYTKIDELEVPHISTDITFHGKYFEYATPDVKGLISNITGGELIGKYEQFKDKLFQQNVRYYLGENSINKKIIESASDAGTRDRFWFLNNGITIVCEDYKIQGITTENIKVQLKNFQIVNGAQTTRAVYDAFKKVGNVDGVKILVKVFKAKEDVAEKITESTNNQNPIDKRDLKSNDEIQKLLEQSLLDLGFYFQRKRKQYSDKPVDKTIDNLLFAQLYYSFFLEKPNEARNQRAKLFGDENIYKQIFNNNLSVGKVIFLYKVYSKILRILRILKAKKIFSSGVIDRSKFFILLGVKFFIEELGQDVNNDIFLNDPKNVDVVSEDLVMKIIEEIDNFIKESVKTSGLNEIKAFQQKTVIDCLRQKFKIGK
jgi:hypothetical protein